MPFSKRTYASLRDFASDFLFPVRNRGRLKRVNRENLLSPAFRERLMMAVTSVNGCRYCSYFHARMALRAGLDHDEIRELLSGGVERCPDDEAVAVAYAQHWAESDARPDSQAVERLEQAYGREKADAIHLMLRMIRMGNLMGNTWDYVVYRLTFGRMGGGAPERM